MSKSRPTSGFKWIDPKGFDLNKYTSNRPRGYVLEVDLEYPKELWELHNGYPVAPDKIEIKREILYEYQLKIINFYNIPTGNIKRLVPNSFDKEKYVFHYENLQLYLRLGLKLKKIHRNQSQWLKPYLEFGDKGGKELYKLMNNAIYGKSVENLRNRINVKLVNNEKGYLKCTSKPSYISRKIFDYYLVAVCKRKVALKLSRPAYIGICISELSKVLMYNFHCDYIENKFGNNSRLLFRDIDSLKYEIKTEDVYEDCSSYEEMFNFSNYSTKSKYYHNSDKLVIGKIKDETDGVVIEEFVGLKPKMYSFLVDNSEHKKAKDMNRNVTIISHNDYKDVLLNTKCILKKLFSQGYCFNFFSSQNNFFVKDIVLIFCLIRTAFFVNL